MATAAYQRVASKEQEENNDITTDGGEKSAGWTRGTSSPDRASSPLGKQIGTMADQKNEIAVQTDVEKAASEWKHKMWVFFVLFMFNGSSLAAVFINKALMAAYNFRFSLTLYFFQAVCTVSIISILRLFGATPSMALGKETFLNLVPCAILSWCNVVCGLKALEHVNIPMFSTLRQLTVLFTLGSEIVALGKYPSMGIFLSVLLMAAGSVMGGLTDSTFTVLGYVLVFMNNTLTALYLVFAKRALSNENSLSPLVLAFYLFGFNSIPTFILWVGTGEAKVVYLLLTTNADYHTLSFGFMLMMSSVSAFAITYFTMLSTDLTSPLTTTVAAQVKTSLQNILGMFSWGYVANALNVTGLMIALAGNCAFALVKYKESIAPPVASSSG
eukprot:CAMPEP_0184699724 /NCGR_PEP_ID=MMETSP0313-20130426/5886_1 /TAXON_ID=2792 /ORGANISM="Porphyridium aerugineum, Strain SAG 1380-2" /LENGTH=385 /DNA_ID=CAMNT_0027158847 /DNA_START=209 /DNA_END=1366 /DNA_ORIENTATION=+